MILFNLVYFCGLERYFYNFDIVIYITNIIENDKIYIFKYFESFDSDKNLFNKINSNIKLRYFD